MPHAICSSSEMKQGTSRSRARRATAHNIAFGPQPITRTRFPRWVSRRASSARVTSPFIPTEPSSVVRCRASPMFSISRRSTRSGAPRPP